MKFLFWLSLLGILYAFIGYPISLYIIKNTRKKINHKKNINYKPKISFIVAAHNEEKSIIDKLNNTILLNYPAENLEIIVSSDNSTDSTNQKVRAFIKEHKNYTILLYEVKERKGKTNAQNEAIKISNGEVIAFSDANSRWDNDSLLELVSNFSDESIEYVCGKLEYVNSFQNVTSNAESTYWNYDLWMRGIESDYGSITAGNGAIYAIRRKNIQLIPDIECHDGLYPTLAVLDGKRAIYEPKAIAYEKAGETSEDEFKRKVRMNRGLLKTKYSYLNKYNPFRVGIFSYFYFCHRYLRYTLYLFHITLLITSAALSKNNFYLAVFLFQLLFYILSLVGGIFKIKIKIIYYPYYYTMTILSQMIAIIKSILGEDKAFWEKAETTR